jgi:hypothetical protein
MKFVSTSLTFLCLGTLYFVRAEKRNIRGLSNIDATVTTTATGASEELLTEPPLIETLPDKLPKEVEGGENESIALPIADSTDKLGSVTTTDDSTRKLGSITDFDATPVVVIHGKRESYSHSRSGSGSGKGKGKGGRYGAYKRDEYRGKGKGGRYDTSYSGQRGGGYKVEGYKVETVVEAGDC